MKELIVRDTFFFDSLRANEFAIKRQSLKELKTKPKYQIFTTNSETMKRQEFYKDLQLCYYIGEEIANPPENLIHIHTDKLFDFFSNTRLRYPEIIDFTNSNFTDKEKSEVLKIFSIAIHNAIQKKLSLLYEYEDKVKEYVPNFEDKKLRFFLTANRHTTVMQYVSSNIYKELKRLGYEVFLSIEKNSMESLHSYFHLKDFLEFKPNVTININHINNNLLHKDMFNFVWFQDQSDIMINQKNVFLRERDYIFSLNTVLDKLLKNKNIKSKRQNFCIDTNIFYNKHQKKEEKIVFVGSGLNDFSKNYTPDQFKIYDSLKYIFTTNPTSITEELLAFIARKYQTSYAFILMYIYPAVLREGCVEYICQQKILPVEIYGRSWDYNKIIAPFFKGELKHGKAINDVYNSSKYILSGVHPYEMYLQRFPESVASGSIPLVYDGTHFTKEKFKYKKFSLLFNTYDELVENLSKSPQKNGSKKISKDMSYSKLVSRFLKIINKELNND